MTDSGAGSRTVRHQISYFSLYCICESTSPNSIINSIIIKCSWQALFLRLVNTHAARACNVLHNVPLDWCQFSQLPIHLPTLNVSQL